MVVVDMIVAKSDFKKFAATLSEDNSGYPSAPNWETLSWETDVPANELLRIRLDPSQAKMVSQTSLTEECATVEFPVVTPKNVARKYTYTYCATCGSATTNSPLQGLA